MKNQRLMRISQTAQYVTVVAGILVAGAVWWAAIPLSFDSQTWKTKVYLRSRMTDAAVRIVENNSARDRQWVRHNFGKPDCVTQQHRNITLHYLIEVEGGRDPFDGGMIHSFSVKCTERGNIDSATIQRHCEADWNRMCSQKADALPWQLTSERTGG